MGQAGAQISELLRIGGPGNSAGEAVAIVPFGARAQPFGHIAQKLIDQPVPGGQVLELAGARLEVLASRKRHLPYFRQVSTKGSTVSEPM